MCANVVMQMVYCSFIRVVYLIDVNSWPFKINASSDKCSCDMWRWRCSTSISPGAHKEKEHLTV